MRSGAADGTWGCVSCDFVESLMQFLTQACLFVECLVHLGSVGDVDPNARLSSGTVHIRNIMQQKRNVA